MRHHEVVISHIGVNVPDLEEARAYYGKLMPLLGFEEFVVTDGHCSYQPTRGEQGAHLYLYPALLAGEFAAGRPGLQHLAFLVESRAAVRAVHDHVVRMGCEVIHEPRNFAEYPSPYYATFWLDPFGMTLEAVCTVDRP
ncbi:VOC family protein [Nonomuraea sp. NBC_01738]|uniref:VOC family protein n=1 Tax=Nonomuraea sp. NBC_01738 TaxID=2976003 RepID=UPI002E104AD0|nr:VOC family protein [Nonomuraea sp. NBC_01738]